MLLGACLTKQSSSVSPPFARFFLNFSFSLSFFFLRNSSILSEADRVGDAVDGRIDDLADATADVLELTSSVVDCVGKADDGRTGDLMDAIEEVFKLTSSVADRIGEAVDGRINGLTDVDAVFVLNFSLAHWIEEEGDEEFPDAVAVEELADADTVGLPDVDAVDGLPYADTLGLPDVDAVEGLPYADEVVGLSSADAGEALPDVEAVRETPAFPCIFEYAGRGVEPNDVYRGSSDHEVRK